MNQASKLHIGLSDVDVPVLPLSEEAMIDSVAYRGFCRDAET
ncbi:hypothetical protein [Oceanobacillus sojae]